MRQTSCQRGITLIEVLVALAVIALALMAALTTASALIRQTQRQSELLLAQICADNALQTLRLQPQMPGVGETTSNCLQAARTLEVRWTIRSTPNPSFRRIDIQVTEGEAPIMTSSSVLGRY